MKWSGEAFFDSSMIVFRGNSVANALHAMPFTVLAMSHDTYPVILDAHGKAVGGPICMIRSMTPHMVAPKRPLTIAFLSPAKWAPVGVRINGEHGGFVQLDPQPFAGQTIQGLTQVSERIAQLFHPDAAETDERLAAALDLLAREPGSVTIAQAASIVGISLSRLRAIAKRDLGAPLSSWLTWKKLEQATHSVAIGDGLAQSALSGGYVDQAHFANVMRRLLGTAPSEIRRIRKLT